MAINDGRVVSNFICQALNQKELTVNGEGSQTRSFQYINDLIDGMIKMMETEKSFIGPVNLGNPSENLICFEYFSVYCELPLRLVLL